MNLPILIVSAATGSGHTRAGEALRLACAAEHPEVEAVHVDLLDLAPRWVRALYGGGYELVASRAPWLWQRIYLHTDGQGEDLARWAPAAERLLFRAFRRLLLGRPWQACVCTHFLPCQVAAGRPGLPPFALALTDFTLHRYWVQPGVRRYFTASEPLAAALRGRVAGAAVEATGIPIAPAFARAPHAAAARAALGLDARRPVVLAMGGGLGLGVERTVDAVLAAGAAAQVVAICGRNAAAQAALAARALPAERLRVLGYVEDVERWLAAADLVVTKPGGLTSSEALALGRPLLLTRPVPGQEEGNAAFLAAAGAAVVAPTDDALRRTAGALLAEPRHLAVLAERARALGRPAAAAAVLARLLPDHLHHRAA